MTLKILYFASVREQLGCASEELALPPDVADVAALLAFLGQRGGAWEGLAAVRNLRYAVNQEIVGLAARVQPGDEVAFFPPVTGG